MSEPTTHSGQKLARLIEGLSDGLMDVPGLDGRLDTEATREIIVNIEREAAAPAEQNLARTIRSSEWFRTMKRSLDRNVQPTTAQIIALVERVAAERAQGGPPLDVDRLEQAIQSADRRYTNRAKIERIAAAYARLGVTPEPSE